MLNTPTLLPEHPITVLLIDDQAMIGEAVRRMLEPETDIIFHYCSDPSAAISKALEVAPTVILQDLVMPEVDGLLLLRFFRVHPDLKDVPMIVLSSKEEPVIKAESFALGANDYMVKLPDKVELLARIRYHSRGYISLLQRNEAYQAVHEYSKKLEQSNELVRRVFGRYLSDEVVANLLETPEGLKLGGERRKITILASDLRGFTATAERLSPEEVIKILNFYLGHMAEVITHYYGTIDEFMGDGILVLFGAPTARQDDAARAVACAIAMQQAMKVVNAQMEEWGLASLEMGIGINTGEVVVGNIGSEKRTKYGVVGSQINLTYRIESYTTGGQILISEQTLQEVGDILTIASHKQVTPKGVQKPITIYEVGGIGGRYNLVLSQPEAEVFYTLKDPLQLQYKLLEGKDISDKAFAGNLVKLSANQAEICVESGSNSDLPGALSNIKFNLVDHARSEVSEDIYGKVVECCPEKERFLIRFTAKPPAIAAKLDALYEELASQKPQLDQLTQLPNRPLFYEQLQQYVDLAEEKGQQVALLCLNLNDFKHINETRGKVIGDLVLKSVAERLTQTLRNTDLVARINGDEFTIILSAIPGAEAAVGVTEKILNALSEPFTIMGETLLITTSVGISLFPGHGIVVEELVKHASTAMLQAKILGNNCYLSWSDLQTLELAAI